MWEKYFPEATIVGIDINPDCLRHAAGRRVVAIGSQADPEFLRSVALQYPPTIVIDDGSHRADYTQLSFETLYPLVAPGGFYVVEDVINHTPEGEPLRGAARVDSADYFMRLALCCMLDHLPAGEQTPFTPLVKATTDRVSFIRRAVFLEKKHRDSVILAELPRLFELVEQSNSVWNWIYLSNFVLRNNGPPERAECAARKAIEISATGPWQYLRLSEALERQGDLPGAVEAMRKVVDLAPHPHWVGRLERLLQQLDVPRVTL